MCDLHRVGVSFCLNLRWNRLSESRAAAKQSEAGVPDLRNASNADDEQQRTVASASVHTLSLINPHSY